MRASARSWGLYMSFSHAPRSLLIAIFVTVLGLGFAYLAVVNSPQYAGLPVLFICAIVAFAVNWLAFIPAAIGQSDKYYDSFGAVTYLSVVGVACLIAWPLDVRAIVVAAMVMVWTIRLGSFLYTRIHASGGTDERFAKIKVNPPRFFVAWSLQAVWVIFTSCAALFIISASEPSPLGSFFWAGSLIWLTGFAFEVIADRQKRAFKANAANKGRFIKHGLWAWSQHPNYFGEITLWFGILVIAFPMLSGRSYLVIISPIFVTLLLTKVSGINLLDKIAEKRWGDDPAYQAYVRKTPALFPRPPAE